MIQFLELKNFRAFEHIRFEDLARANLIIGGNNTGKTSVLEALVLKLGSGQQIQKLPSTFREQIQGDEFASYWNMIPHHSNWQGFAIKANDSWVYQDQNQNDVSRLLEDKDGNCRVIGKIKPDAFNVSALESKDPASVIPTKASTPASISELFNQIAPLNPDNEDRLERLLRQSVEPRLKRLRYAKPKGTKTHLVYADLGNGPMLPFTQLGQAFCRVLEIYCEIFANQPKVILIDEIENGLYYEGLSDFWNGLYEVLEDQDVQLFATTHSRECMEAAHKAAAARKEYPLRYLRLDRRIDNPEKIVATTFGQEVMQTAIDSKMEMR